MSSRDEVTLPATRPRSRKSLAHVPSSRSMDQENMTADLGSLATNGKRTTPMDKTSKKSRSKSIGPGGLDALTDTSGNRRKVGAYSSLEKSRGYLLTNAQVTRSHTSNYAEINPQTHHAAIARDTRTQVLSDCKS